MNIRNRLIQLEKTHTTKQEYMCVYYLEDGIASPRDPQGYKIQPCMTKWGGAIGEPFYLPTIADVESFGARPDVELTKIVIEYVDYFFNSEKHNQ